MFVGDHDQFGAAALRARIEARLFGTDVGNGTPVAAVVDDALRLDRRMSGRDDGLAVHAELSDEDLQDIAFEIMSTVDHSSSSFELPLGTVMESRARGDLRIGGEHWILDRSRPGLHAMEMMRRDAHGANLEILRAHIRRLTRGRVCRQIGLPEPAFIVDVDARHLLHFPPCEAAGGVVLQRWANGTDAPRFAAALPHQILEFAESIVEDMRTLWKRRKEIAQRAAELRDVLDGSAREHGATVALLAVDLQEQAAELPIDFYVHFTAIDEAMRPGPVLDFVPPHRATVDSYRAPWGVNGRGDERAELRAVGADGWIDDVAAAVADVAPGGAAAVFATLAEEYETTFAVTTDGAPLFATLYWRDGTIRAEISMSERLDWCHVSRRLELKGVSLPASVEAVAAGRPLDALVGLPFPCDVRVRSAETKDWGIRFELEEGRRLVDLATGRMWGDEDAR